MIDSPFQFILIVCCKSRILVCCKSRIFRSVIETLICHEEIELNPFPNKPWFLRVCNTSLLKTLWGKREKLLITSDFSFFHSVFYPFEELSSIFIEFQIVVWKLFQFENVSLGKGITLSQSSPGFYVFTV